MPVHERPDSESTPMTRTSLTMLNRLQQSSDPETWTQFVDLYQPLLRAWLSRYDVQTSDADDLIQEVLMAVSKDLDGFDHNGRTGAFRNWMRSILVNRLRNFWRQRGRVAQTPADSDIERRISQLDDPNSELSQLWNRQHDQHVAQRLLAVTQQHFTAESWSAFIRVTMDGLPPDSVAAELGISVNAVFIAKSRVLSRLRQEAAGLLDGSTDFPAKC